MMRNAFRLLNEYLGRMLHTAEIRLVEERWGQMVSGVAIGQCEVSVDRLAARAKEHIHSVISRILFVMVLVLVESIIPGL